MNRPLNRLSDPIVLHVVATLPTSGKARRHSLPPTTFSKPIGIGMESGRFHFDFAQRSTLAACGLPTYTEEKRMIGKQLLNGFTSQRSSRYSGFRCAVYASCRGKATKKTVRHGLHYVGVTGGSGVFGRCGTNIHHSSQTIPSNCL